ncbi:MAG: hypothetical protein AAFV85_23220 [Cyanobacteria bacterium J06634_6]
MDEELAAALARSVPGKRITRVQIPEQFSQAAQEAHEKVTQKNNGNTASKNS